MDTQVEERGTMLSGGQKQRIGIALAILRNAALLLQAGTVIIFANSWMLLQPLALEIIYYRHFKFFLNSFLFTRAFPAWYVQKAWFWLVHHETWFEMRESYGIRDSHSTYKTMNYYYKSKCCHLMKQDLL